MKKHKLLSFLLLISIVLQSVTAFALIDDKSYTPDVVVSLQIGNSVMKINGADTQIDIGRPTVPTIKDGRTLIPIRAVIEAFDGTVQWDEDTKTVFLYISDDEIKLTIDNYTAYLNGKQQILDVAPTVINDRTMLPIRFVAESFNLGVAWSEKDQTVYIIRNGFDSDEYENLESMLQPYEDNAYTEINGNIPFFKDYEIIDSSFEYYSTLDNLGRCDVCMASVSKETMPQQTRESISNVTPTGWINAAYDIVSGKYLYNRCHLIGYQLTGENANERNLITGTRYLNIDGMLLFENAVDDYVEKTGNHVMYRVTPVFSENNLLADGVLMEAYSVEDKGSGIKFCVYCYNVQPGIYIDYSTGKSSLESENPISEVNSVNKQQGAVYRTPSGKKYHFDKECGGKSSFETTLDKAINSGLTPCSKCAN